MKGQTPVIQFHFNWKQLSMIAGLHPIAQCMFRLHEGAIRSAQLVEFLKALRRHLRDAPAGDLGRIASASQSAGARVRRLDRGRTSEWDFKPTHASESNPVEISVGLAEAPRAGQFLPDTASASWPPTARAKLKLPRSAAVSIIAACWIQADLF